MKKYELILDDSIYLLDRKLFLILTLSHFGSFKEQGETHERD